MQAIHLVLILAFSALQVSAQNSMFPWSIGFGGGVVNYQSAPGSDALSFSNWDPVGELRVGRYLSRGFDFRTHILAGPVVNFPVSELNTQERWMVDMNYTMVLKLYGTIFPEKAVIGPYLLAGLGGSYVEQNPDAYFPFGGGFKIRMTARLDIFLQAIQKISFNNDYQHLALTGGLGFNFWDHKTRPHTRPLLLQQPGMTRALLPADRDRDGTPDAIDACPDDAGLVSLRGCPPEMELPVKEPVVVETPEEKPYTPPEEPEPQTADNPPAPVVVPLPPPVDPEEPAECPGIKKSIQDLPPLYFDSGKYTLNQENKNVLSQLAGLLKACPQLKLRMVGHADASGNDRKNIILSIRRAHAVKYHLVYTHDISQHRLESEGQGASQPIAENETKQGRQLNRRVEFFILR